MKSLKTSDYIKSSIECMEANSQQEAFKIMTKSLCKLFSADYGTVLLAKDGQLSRVYANSPLIFKSQIRNDGRTYTVYKSRTPQIAYVEQFYDLQPEQHTLGIKSVLFIPLAYKRKNLGVLNILSREKLSLTSNDLKTIQFLGKHLALALEQVKKIEETQTKLENKNLFISFASHELKTPLTAITMYLQLIDKQVREGKKVDSHSFTVLKAETKRVTQLIDELLIKDQSNKPNLTYNLQSVSLSEVLWRARQAFKVSQQRHILDVRSKLDNGSDIVYGDFDKLLQVVLNILNNAAKFSPPTSTIILSAQAKDDTFIISVKDQGHGIPQKDIPLIFEKFYRIKEPGVKGMGLGLYLSHQIIAEHKGEIKVRSQVGKGTTVAIILPQQKEDEPSRTQIQSK